MDTTFVPRGMEERLLYLLRYCISLPREEITVDFHKIETTTLRTPVATRNGAYRCVLTGAPVFIVLVFLCSTYPPNRFNIHMHVSMRYITYLNWKFDKYSTDSIKYFKVSDRPSRGQRPANGDGKFKCVNKKFKHQLRLKYNFLFQYSKLSLLLK